MTKQYHFALKTPFLPASRRNGTLCRALWFIFGEDKLLVQNPQERHRNNLYGLAGICRPAGDLHQISRAIWGCRLFCRGTGRHPGSPPAMQFRGLRSLFGVIEADLFSLAGRAIQILHWHRDHRFCGK